MSLASPANQIRDRSESYACSLFFGPKWRILQTQFLFPQHPPYLPTHAIAASMFVRLCTSSARLGQAGEEHDEHISGKHTSSAMSAIASSGRRISSSTFRYEGDRTVGLPREAGAARSAVSFAWRRGRPLFQRGSASGRPWWVSPIRCRSRYLAGSTSTRRRCSEAASSTLGKNQPHQQLGLFRVIDGSPRSTVTPSL